MSATHTRQVTEHVAQRLREARAGKDWSQDQLAGACGWSQAAISLYESGRRSVGIHALCELAAALDRPLSFFLDDLPPAVSPPQTNAPSAEQQEQEAQTHEYAMPEMPRVRAWLQWEGQPQRELTEGFRVEADGRVSFPLALQGEQAILTVQLAVSAPAEPTEAQVEIVTKKLIAWGLCTRRRERAKELLAALSESPVAASAIREVRELLIAIRDARPVSLMYQAYRAEVESKAREALRVLAASPVRGERRDVEIAANAVQIGDKVPSSGDLWRIVGRTGPGGTHVRLTAESSDGEWSSTRTLDANDLLHVVRDSPPVPAAEATEEP